MKRLLYPILLFALLLTANCFSGLQAQGVHKKAQIKLLFKQGNSHIDRELLANADSINKFIRMVEEVKQDTAFTLVAARINSSCSPEGSYESNKRLSSGRTNALYNYLSTYLPSDSLLLVQNSIGIGWRQLYDLMEESTYTNRQAVMDIISDEPELVTLNGKQIERRKQALHELNGGKTYNYLYKHYFPLLRNASLELIYYKKSDRLTVDIATTPLKIATYNNDYNYTPPLLPHQPFEVKEQAPVSTIEDPRFAIKTNMLFLAALAPNIEVEYAFARRFSVSVDYNFAWWKKKPDHKFYRFLYGSAELKYWFASKQRLKGHYFSLFIADGKYEFMRKADYGFQGELNWVPGASYGYSMPISRKVKNLNLELSAGVGFTKTEYREYHYDEGCYVYDYTKRKVVVLPIKTKVSLSWQFGYKPRK